MLNSDVQNVSLESIAAEVERARKSDAAWNENQLQEDLWNIKSAIIRASTHNSRFINIWLRQPKRSVQFYKDIGIELGVAVPRCLFALACLIPTLPLVAIGLAGCSPLRTGVIVPLVLSIVLAVIISSAWIYYAYEYTRGMYTIKSKVLSKLR